MTSPPLPVFPPSFRLSLLDRSPVRKGQDPAQALRDTVWLAQRAEELGYHRFWVSEHHGVPGLAGSAPTVLAAAIAGATSRIRVGTGGVMLPNHRPLVVAEQFGVLESLFPGRIDMGLGRSVGFTDGVRRALGKDMGAADDFAGLLTELLGYFTGSPGGGTAVHARPPEGLRLPTFVLATGSGAAQAAAFGLPLVIAGRDEGRMRAAIDRYRAEFRPSAWAARPYVVVSTPVAVAATTEAARRLLVSEAWSAAYSRDHGEFPPLGPPAEILAGPMTARERGRFEESLAGGIHGTEAEAGAALAGLVARTGADEVLVSTAGYDRAALLDSHRRLARAAGLGTDRRPAGTGVVSA
ncbi:LLM class flavin-dependent oxidoreductase [Streptomyces sp. NPDC088354]|uniref:LLM class flavin-dependent oxidoreductase n=1 Tax=unclassified Streptomyces TaxID=2593676 RepID=UPI0029B75168|nr:LLM class flavin-dependent oxidoreductase [Streptomyces sp. MI02-7b]MDX3073804.1 LLM class flavin-dependent oxidoreductase [Streptomyces sp. MI02-7b]